MPLHTFGQSEMVTCHPCKEFLGETFLGATVQYRVADVIHRGKIMPINLEDEVKEVDGHAGIPITEEIMSPHYFSHGRIVAHDLQLLIPLHTRAVRWLQELRNHPQRKPSHST